MENYWSIVLYVTGAWVFFNKTKITHDKGSRYIQISLILYMASICNINVI